MPRAARSAQEPTSPKGAKQARTAKPRVPAPARPDDSVKGHDEKNFATLVMMPTAPRVPPDLIRWEKRIVRPGGHVATLTVTAAGGHVVPHGADNDVMVALINLYVEQGAPDDRWVQTTAHELLLTMNSAIGGRQYEQLRVSLDRLHGAKFAVTDGWYELKGRRYTTQSFIPLSAVTTTGAQAEDGSARFDNRTILRIQLHETITDSIRDGYVRPLDMALYQALQTDASRALYRYLDVEFDRLRAAGQGPYAYAADALVVASNLGLSTDRFDMVLQRLKKVNEDLVQTGYLGAVTVTGRGRKARFTYELAPAQAAAGPQADPELLALVRAHGVFPKPAARFVLQLGERVRTVVRRFEEHVGSGKPVADRGAYLAALLADEVQMMTAPAPGGPPKPLVSPAPPARGKAAPPEPLLLAPATVATVLSGFRLKKLKALGFSAAEQDRLLGRAQDGQVDLEDLRRAFAKLDMLAAQPDTAGDAVAEFRQVFLSD